MEIITSQGRNFNLFLNITIKLHFWHILKKKVNPKVVWFSQNNALYLFFALISLTLLRLFVPEQLINWNIQMISLNPFCLHSLD